MSFTPNKHTSFLKWSSKIICIIIMCCFLPSCNDKQENTNPVMKSLYQFPAFKPVASTKAIVVIADNSCMTCNKELARLTANYLTRPDILFVIAARESTIDLTPYINTSRKDIVFDYNHVLADNEIVKGSTVLLLKNKEVDTMIQIQASVLEEQLTFLKQAL